MARLWQLIAGVLAANGYTTRNDGLHISADCLAFGFVCNGYVDIEKIDHVRRLQQAANTLTRELSKRVEIGAKEFKLTIWVRI